MYGETPIVTFVMPAYNASAYIGQAIESVINQTEHRWQLTVVDDGSTDSTRDIVSRYAAADPRIKLKLMPEASGSAYQPRKKAIVEAVTEWVSPLDADDFIAPDYLEKLLAMQSATDADAVYPTMYDSVSKNRMKPLDDTLYNSPVCGKECVALTLDGWKINCNGGLLRKADYMQAYRNYASDMTYSCADELLTRQLLHAISRIAFSETAYFYRSNPDSITRKPSVKLFDYLINNVALIDFTLLNYGEESDEYKLASSQNFHGIFDALRLLNRYKFTKEEKKSAWQLIDKAVNKIDKRIITGRVSRNYEFLLKPGVRVSRYLLKIADSILKNK